MTAFVIPCIAAFAASAGFSILYEIRGKKIIIASLCGFFAWAAYLLTYHIWGMEIFSYFVAGSVVALYSELSAYVFKNPVTVFLTPGIIPTVPGLTIYHTMQACLYGDTEQFLEYGIKTLKIGGAIVLGLILVSSLWRMIRAIIGRLCRKIVEE